MSDRAGAQTRRRLLQETTWAAGAAALLNTNAGAQTAASAGDQPACMRFFPSGFRNERIKTSGAEINTVIGGSGPPLLLFHGAPQSGVPWRLVAPHLANDFTRVSCDLRGYGDSSKPADQPKPPSQSKRPMALNGVEVMEH